MKITDLSIADLYALYWHFSDLLPHEDSTDYDENPEIILEACRRELDRRLILLHNSIKDNENSSK